MHAQCMPLDSVIVGWGKSKAPCKLSLFWELPFGVLEASLYHHFIPLVMLNQLSLTPKQCAFFIDFFVLYEGHSYPKWINKMNKVQVALDSRKLWRVEDPLQKTQKLKSKMKTGFKVFCLAISLNSEGWYYYTGVWNESLCDSLLHQTKVKGLQYYQEFFFQYYQELL